MKNKSLRIHPYLFGILPPLLIYSHNIGEASLGEFLVYALGMIIGVGFLLFAVNAVVKDRFKTGAFVSLFLLFFFSYGHFWGLIQDMRIRGGGMEWGPNALLYPVFGILFLSGACFIHRSRDLTALNRRLNLFSVVLVGLFLLDVARFGLTESRQPAVTQGEPSSGKIPAAFRGAPRPDIYYIVLDGYARADYLRDIFHYDNSPFLNGLRRRGFHVADKSISNYVFTTHSVASTLNMDYLQNLFKGMNEASTNRKPISDLLIHSRVLTFVREKGYQVVVISCSGFSTPLKIPAAKQLYYHQTLSEFQNELLNLTPIPVLIRRLSRRGAFQYDFHRKDVFSALDRLGQVAALPSPKFVYAHIFSPHAPFVFGPNGEPVTPSEPFSYRSSLKGEAYFKSHNQQMSFLNQRIASAVDSILENSPEPPVILLMSDHGHRYQLNPKVTDNPEQILKESMSNLSAFYLPGGGGGKFYETLSPVNSFRIVFNRYFGMDLPLLPDRAYYSTAERPYQFFDVTEKIR